MKKLLNTLFVLTEDAYLSLENQNAVVNFEDGTRKLFPLIGLEEILSFSYKGASPALIGECARRDISFVMLTPRGRFLAQAAGRTQGNVLLRKEQYRIAESGERKLAIARNMIIGKLCNSRWSLERSIRDHGLRIETEKVKTASERILSAIHQIGQASDLDSLRGIEGEAAAVYFSVFNELILNQKEDFTFADRSRRPPMDRMNAMLSFGYAILRNDCASALESVGLDPYVGVMHGDRPGRESLALDFMEELRPVMVDRMALTLVNNRMIDRKSFDCQEDGSVLLNDKGRKIFLSFWQERKRSEITHPFLKEKMQWGLVPYIQSLLLTRYIRGDLDSYPPFLWK